MIVARSAFGHHETVARVADAIAAHGLTLFARIDHAAAARAAGLDLQDEIVLLFGNPRAGTLLMQSDPRIGIELPLRILIWTDASGVQLGYRDPRELGERYVAAAEHEPILERMAILLESLVDDAVR
jgi:uncharacterized protein (DUF302 family)